jgi:hypothetical protein
MIVDHGSSLMNLLPVYTLVVGYLLFIDNTVKFREGSVHDYV